MADAPPFDPNKPFEAVEPKTGGVPAFDPSKPYEEIKPTWGETAKDVGKSLVSGAASGITGLAGLPGDIAGLFPESWRDKDARLPTSKQIQEKAEEKTGKFYEPQTTAGKYAHTV